MRKTIGITLMLVVLCAAVLIIGCERRQAGTDGLPLIGAAIYRFDDTFMSYVRNTIQESAAGRAQLSMVDSQNQQPVQNDQVDQFITQGMNAIAINPVDRTAARTILEKAMAAEVPVVFFNREPFAEDMQLWDKVYYVGARAADSGTMQGEMIVDYWRANPSADRNGDGVLQVIILKGEPGHQDAEARTEYSVRAIRDAGIEVEILAEDFANWQRPIAVEKMDAFWASFGDRIEAIICNNDDMALGAIESLRKAGIFSGDSFIPIVGVDATAPALQAMAEGTLLGSALNDALNQGRATFDLAYALATGANPAAAGWNIENGQYVWVPYQKVTLDNFRDFQ
ncbi:MAG: galactose ABC transporter substrate-binding protein [Treponema sp.]|nr:galactose ABC transporter substrate-binding protein [Treponema sp.]